MDACKPLPAGAVYFGTFENLKIYFGKQNGTGAGAYTRPLFSSS